MSVGAELEAPRPPAGAGFSDAVTVAFADVRAGVFGLARAGLADGRASGLAVLFRGRDPVVAAARGDVEPAGDGWEGVRAGGVTTEVVEPLRRWTTAFSADGGGFELDLEGLGEPAELGSGGMEGYEHLCRVRGRATVGGERIAIDCLGQRGHSWGTPDWERLALARTVGAWLGDDLAVVLSAARPARAGDHGAEELAAVVLEGTPPVPVEISDPRLSTTYDGEGRQLRAGLELWPADEEAYARRGAGELLCGTTLDLGRLRMDTAFFHWRMDGREGVGRYDLLRRTA